MRLQELRKQQLFKFCWDTTSAQFYTAHKTIPPWYSWLLSPPATFYKTSGFVLGSSAAHPWWTGKLHLCHFDVYGAEVWRWEGESIQVGKSQRNLYLSACWTHMRMVCDCLGILQKVKSRPSCWVSSESRGWRFNLVRLFMKACKAWTAFLT